MIGIRATLTNLEDPQVVRMRKVLLGGFMKSYLGAMESYICEMFGTLGRSMSGNLVRNCCAGRNCHGDEVDAKIFYNCILDIWEDNVVIVWLRLGRDQEFVMNSDPPPRCEIVAGR